MNTWSADAQHTPFDKLEGTGDTRFVDGRFMDREEYDACDWRVDGNGYWRASLQGLQRFGRLKAERKEERRSSWKARVERDEEWSEQMTALIEEGTKK